VCRQCRRFGHLAQKYKSGEEQKKKTVVGNKFEVLESHMIQYGVREVRKQEVVEERPQCFKCGEKEHKKWECPRSRERKRKEKVAPLQNMWRKVKEHSGVKGLSLRGAKMSMKGWTMKWEVVTFVECQ